MSEYGIENIDNVKKLTRASMMVVFAFIITFIGARLGTAMFNQFVVGPLINAVIISAVLYTDLKFGVLVSLVTPLLAVITGQFTAVPFAPFIMAGNATLAVIFYCCSKYAGKFGSYIGIAAGALLKTIVLTVSIRYLVALFKIGLPKPMVAKLSVMMSYPQLYSAVAGGIVAMIFYSIFAKRIKNQ